MDKLELQRFNRESVEEKVEPSSLEHHELQKQEDETQVIPIENLLGQSSDSLRTEVQAKDLIREDFGTDSDTSTALPDPPRNLSLVLRNVVCEETEAQRDPEGEGDSQPIIFAADVHQHGNEEVHVHVSDSPEPPMVNRFPTCNTPLSPTHSAETYSDQNGINGYAQPLADTNGESSQLLVTYTSTRTHTCMRPDLPGNGLENQNLSSTATTRDESSIQPVQNTDNSQAYLVVSDASRPSFHPDSLQDRCHSYDDRTNTAEHRRLVTQVVGGGLPRDDLEPDNDRQLVDNADIVRQVPGDSEHLIGDPNVDVLRQLSTDSEENRG